MLFSLLTTSLVILVANVHLHPPEQSTNMSLSDFIDFTLKTCDKCNHFLNGCTNLTGFFGINCPINGTDTCRSCLELQEVAQSTEAGTNKPEILRGIRRSKRASSSCHHFKELCSNGICCKNEGLRCQSSSQGRGRNHLVCAYT